MYVSAFDIFINLVESYLLSFLCYVLLTKKVHRSTFSIMMLGIFLTIETTILNYLSLFTPLQGFITNASIVIFALYYSSDSLVYKIAAGFVPLMLLDICNMIIMICFMLIQQKEISYLLMNGDYVSIVLFSKLLFLFFTFNIWILKKRHDLDITGYIDESWWPLILIIFFFSIMNNVLFSVLFIGTIQFYESLVILTSLILMIISMIFLLRNIIEVNKIKAEAELNHQILQNKIEEYKKEEERYHEIKELKHDMKHIYVYMRNLMEQKDYETLESLIKGQIGMVTVNQDFYTTNNRIVNMVLREQFKLAKKKNIEFTTDIKLPDQLKIKDVDLYRILSNLIDNAIENCSIDEPSIKIEAILRHEYVHIKIANSIEESMMKKNPNLMTHKANKQEHGYGIKSVKRILKQYKGMIEYSENGKKIICEVIFEEK